MRALAANGQTAPVTDPSIATYLYQSLDVHLYALAQVAFDVAFAFYNGADARKILFGKLANLLARKLDGILAETRGRFTQYLLRARTAYTVNVGQTDLGSLVVRQIHAGNTCHISSSRSRIADSFVNPYSAIYNRILSATLGAVCASGLRRSPSRLRGDG